MHLKSVYNERQERAIGPPVLENRAGKTGREASNEDSTVKGPGWVSHPLLGGVAAGRGGFLMRPSVKPTPPLRGTKRGFSPGVRASLPGSAGFQPAKEKPGRQDACAPRKRKTRQARGPRSQETSTEPGCWRPQPGSNLSSATITPPWAISAPVIHLSRSDLTSARLASLPGSAGFQPAKEKPGRQEACAPRKRKNSGQEAHAPRKRKNSGQEACAPRRQAQNRAAGGLSPVAI